MGAPGFALAKNIQCFLIGYGVLLTFTDEFSDFFKMEFNLLVVVDKDLVCDVDCKGAVALIVTPQSFLGNIFNKMKKDVLEILELVWILMKNF